MFTITTKHDKAGVLALSKHQFYKQMKWVCIFFTAFALFVAVMTGIILLGVLLLIIALPIGLLAGRLMLSLMVKLQLSKNKIIGDSTFNEFIFSADRTFKVVTFRDGQRISETLLRQDDIHKVTASSEYVFIFISRMLAFFINKKDMTPEQINFLLNIKLIPPQQVGGATAQQGNGAIAQQQSGGAIEAQRGDGANPLQADSNQPDTADTAEKREKDGD
jgi:hypothetical protein